MKTADILDQKIQDGTIMGTAVRELLQHDLDEAPSAITEPVVPLLDKKFGDLVQAEVEAIVTFYYQLADYHFDRARAMVGRLRAALSPRT